MSKHTENIVTKSASSERHSLAVVGLLVNGWMALGQALHRLTSPLILGVLYFGLLTPVALVCRLCGHDPLGLQYRKTASYWAISNPVAPESFRRQF